MEDDVELKVRYASASLEGDMARIAVVTERGRLTLQMHRVVLGALAGTIARAMFPRTSEPVVPLGDEAVALSGDVPIAPLGDAAPDDVAQVDLPGPEGGAITALAQAEDIPTQPEAHEPEPDSPAGAKRSRVSRAQQ
jgi:hypothetical protein